MPSSIMKRYVTKATLARLLGVDQRAKAIKQARPVAELLAGKKLIPLYEVKN